MWEKILDIFYSVFFAVIGKLYLRRVKQLDEQADKEEEEDRLR